MRSRLQVRFDLRLHARQQMLRRLRLRQVIGVELMMKQMVFAAGLALAATAAPAGSAELAGRWATPSSGGVVEIAPCGEAVCGHLVRSVFLSIDPTLRDRKNRDKALRTRPLKGTTILSGFQGGPAAWRGGEVYNPNDGRTYAGSLELISANQLKLTACGVARRCRIQVWNRLEK